MTKNDLIFYFKAMAWLLTREEHAVFHSKQLQIKSHIMPKYLHYSPSHPNVLVKNNKH